MRKGINILLKSMGILLLVIIFLVIAVLIFVNTAPQFGAVIKGQRLEELQASSNYKDGQFQNLVETNMDMGLWEGLKLLPEVLFDTEGREPKRPLPTAYDKGGSALTDTAVFLTWYGHSAFLLEMQGMKVLLDPMLGPASSPVPFFTRRFPNEQPIDLSDVPAVDAVILSHDHYDHLDYYTIKRIRDRVGHFYTPLGVGEHLKRWGVAPDKITELDWWESVSLGPLNLVASPARHFSGRGFTDRNKTQWASWVIVGGKSRLYFSGDSGYAGHFQEIGNKYGPFDLAMVECGQYNERWEAIHMMPEQSVRAATDLRAKTMMPIHWGGFNLSLHAWTEPIERAIREAGSAGVNLTCPMIGRRFEITESWTDRWWEGVE